MTTPVLDIADAVSSATASALEAIAPAPVVDAPASGAEDQAPVADQAPADLEAAAAAAADSVAGGDVGATGDDADQGGNAPTEETVGEDDGEGAGEAAGDAPALPDGFVAVPVVDGDLATEFILRDADGEVEVPALIVEYKANGKVRQDRLDQVVKLAQWGVYNQEREAKVKDTEQQAYAVAQERDQYAQLIAEREAQIERLLTDDEFLYTVREAYANENAPERRAARAEEQLQQYQVQQQIERIATEGQSFFQGQIEPALSLIAQSLPSVSAEELSNRMMYAMQAHVEQGPGGVPYIPASRYQAVKEYIVQDLAPWAQFEHNRRSAGSTPSTPAKPADVIDINDARVASQKAKRALGQQTKPIGSAPTGSAAKDAAPKKAPKPNTLDDAVDSALSEILASLR